MKAIECKKTLMVVAALLSASAMSAQDDVETSVGADLVSGYVWRGQDLGGVSIQPSVGVSYKGFSLSAWGSVGFSQDDAKEVDLILSYSNGGFSVGVTDYWFTGGPGYFHYSSDNTMHTFEASVGYDFGPLAMNWFTNFAGAVGYNEEGKKAYASYFSISAPFRLGGLDWSAEVGATPWANDYYNGGATGFQVSSVSLSASKDIKITDSFSFPLWAQIVWNPATEGAWFVAGVSF